jgi:hypothetical protein
VGKIVCSDFDGGHGARTILPAMKNEARLCPPHELLK